MEARGRRLAVMRSTAVAAARPARELPFPAAVGHVQAEAALVARVACVPQAAVLALVQLAEMVRLLLAARAVTAWPPTSLARPFTTAQAQAEWWTLAHPARRA